MSSRQGLVHHCFVDGGLTRNRFSAFLFEARRLAYNKCAIIYDNAATHRNHPNLPRGDQVIQPLPRYSPFLDDENGRLFSQSFCQTAADRTRHPA